MLEVSEPAPGDVRLVVTLDYVETCIDLKWSGPNSQPIASGTIKCTGINQLSWTLKCDDETYVAVSSNHLNSIRAELKRWLLLVPVRESNVSARSVVEDVQGKPSVSRESPFVSGRSPFSQLETYIKDMGIEVGREMTLRERFGVEPDPPDFLRYQDRLFRKAAKLRDEEEKRLKTMRRIAAERETKRRLEERKQKTQSRPPENKPQERQVAPVSRPPLPPVPVRVELPGLGFQESTFTLENLGTYALQEQAAQWWVANQTDTLIALPYCRIEQLDYQVRTALRVLGSLRGRALLSDEVGLGKTVEAGLVLKEWLVRGMVKRFLVLTVPSLVDQWQEELSDKFNLQVATTNQPEFRSDSPGFWTGNMGIVASLHTLKQPAQLAVARTVNWDLVIVDEAHYLRNRDSQSWQAVNALPRQFLLLLTATPVQNSLEELYNLVTLLQPGRLPSPKEFRARFMDPKRPRQPKEPEELRRLLGQVMIRNTRANSGVNLPPRRAETVLFEAAPHEQKLLQEWDGELRSKLKELNQSQASLWGRLLLQAMGSSPRAWEETLARFPDADFARRWRERALLAASWRTKCQLLPTLAKGEGGVVIFTQFLHTQAAIAEFLREAGVSTFVVNGSTPAPERQPITEAFKAAGGALLLTHSGTEGRNLQFCHRLVNFDLPWNPMEIEQRIGRLHRLGQKHAVQIFNLVQRGTLQEHLLEILQEKLNLFELVVGETGLILGERFAGEEFADEVLRRWQESDGNVAEAMNELGLELAAARGEYQEVRNLDETLFAKDYESL